MTQSPVFNVNSIAYLKEKLEVDSFRLLTDGHILISRGDEHFFGGHVSDAIAALGIKNVPQISLHYKLSRYNVEHPQALSPTVPTLLGSLTGDGETLLATILPNSGQEGVKYVVRFYCPISKELSTAMVDSEIMQKISLLGREYLYQVGIRFWLMMYFKETK